jgi:glycosyltransferase involved in cell wall biosynthesis
VTDRRVCTIITRATVAEARVLADGLGVDDAPVEMVALWLDPSVPPRDLAPPWELLQPDDLGLDVGSWHRMAVVHEPSDLAAAFRPHLLAAMFERGQEPVLFLDATVQVYGSVGPLFDDFDGAEIVLVPKTLHPIPDDGQEPRQRDVLATGMFDPGVLGVRLGAVPFLDLWAADTAWEASGEDAGGRHPDSWLDLAPLYTRAHIVRDPGFGVAYWNVHERALRTGEGGELLVDDHPLRLLRYEGFDAARPYLLTTDVKDQPRVEAIDDPVLASLCADRALRLAEQPELALDPAAAPTFDRLANGVRIDAHIRSLYRRELIAASQAGRSLPPDPFVAGGDTAIVDWLNERVAGTPAAPVSRYLYWVWQGRPDLQIAVRDPLGAGAADLFDWARTAEDFALDCQPALMPHASVGEPMAPELLPGFNLVGFLAAEFGLGDMARAALAGIAAAGVPVATRSISDWTQARQQASFRPSGEGNLPYRVNLLAVMANETVIMSRDPATRWMLNDRYNVGLWFWEVDRFDPASAEGFRLVDEIWVATDYMREIFEKASDRPVRKYTLPVDGYDDRTHLTRDDLGLPDGYLFGFIFDFLSVFERKNPIGLIDAYRAAFGPDDGAHLVIKSVGAGRRRADAARLRHAVADRDDIVLLDGFISTIEMRSLFQHFDCYASLHRSEGFGATMARSMACGKPTIATAYSGNLDFMTDDTSYLVPYDLVEVGPDAAPYPADSVWAEPDLTVAAEMMRRVFDEPTEARRRGELARERVRATHSVDRAGEFFAEQFERIYFDE